MTSRFRIGPSKIHGKGVIATLDFKRGQRVFVLKGKKKKLHIRDSRDSVLGPNWIGFEKEVWIDPEYPSLFINHSCNPNMGIKGRVTFTALRNIKSGEELTYDYSISEDDVYWKFRCHCGERNCRKDIKSIQSLPPKVFQHYLPFIPRYFQKVYNVSHRI